MTATASMARLMNDVRIELPGALDNVVQQIMFSVFTEFCKQTNVWREDIPVSVVSGTTTYELVPTGAASIFRFMWLLDSNGVPQPATMSVPGCLVLVNTPSQNDTWTATVAEKPIDPVDEDLYPQFPDWVIDKYRDDFVEGILGRMMSQPAKPYTNPQMATYHLKRWRNAMAVARVEVQRTNGYRIQAWSFPQNFSVTPRRGLWGTSTGNPQTFQ